MNISLFLWIAACISFQGSLLSICALFIISWHHSALIHWPKVHMIRASVVLILHFEICLWVVSFPLCRNFCPVSLLCIKSFVWYDASTKTLTKSGLLTIWSLISMSSFYLSLAIVSVSFNIEAKPVFFFKGSKTLNNGSFFHNSSFWYKWQYN